MIACRSLTMKYGDFTAVDQLDLEVAKGEICALLGPNGAGKSTTLKMLTGLATPTSGSVTVAGASPAQVKTRMGVLPEKLGLFDDLTVIEHLELSADLYALPGQVARERIGQLLRVLNLEHGRDTLASRCSHGMRKKTSFAMALLHNPEVLFLDEPFEAIDPVSARLMFEVLQDAANRGTTVFLTSHILAMVEALAGRFVLIRAGRVVLNGTRAELPGPLADLYFDLVESPVTEKLEWLGSGRS
jgi:ABC-2 type transport system ATP-binding protein